MKPIDPSNGCCGGLDSFTCPKLKIIPDWATVILLFAAPIIVLVFTQMFLRNIKDFDAALHCMILAVVIM